MKTMLHLNLFHVNEFQWWWTMSFAYSHHLRIIINEDEKLPSHCVCCRYVDNNNNNLRSIDILCVLLLLLLLLHKMQSPNQKRRRKINAKENGRKNVMAFDAQYAHSIQMTLQWNPEILKIEREKIVVRCSLYSNVAKSIEW